MTPESPRREMRLGVIGQWYTVIPKRGQGFEIGF
jgi:hypothetical protein